MEITLHRFLFADPYIGIVNNEYSLFTIYYLYSPQYRPLVPLMAYIFIGSQMMCKAERAFVIFSEAAAQQSALP